MVHANRYVTVYSPDVRFTALTISFQNISTVVAPPFTLSTGEAISTFPKAAENTIGFVYFLPPQTIPTEVSMAELVFNGVPSFDLTSMNAGDATFLEGANDELRRTVIIDFGPLPPPPSPPPSPLSPPPLASPPISPPPSPPNPCAACELFFSNTANEGSAKSLATAGGLCAPGNGVALWYNGGVSPGVTSTTECYINHNGKLRYCFEYTLLSYEDGPNYDDRLNCHPAQPKDPTHLEIAVLILSRQFTISPHDSCTHPRVRYAHLVAVFG